MQNHPELKTDPSFGRSSRWWEEKRTDFMWKQPVRKDLFCTTETSSWLQVSVKSRKGAERNRNPRLEPHVERSPRMHKHRLID